MHALASVFSFAVRMCGTALGVALLAAAFTAEFARQLIPPALSHAPEIAQRLVETALARENVVHAAAAAFALCGLVITVSSWPLLIAGVALLARACISAIGAALIVAAVILALDPSFLGLIAEVAPPLDADEEGGGGGGVLVQAAAALLALFGAALAAAPWWRRNDFAE